VAAVLLYRALVILPTLLVGGVALAAFHVWAPSGAETTP
jgi:hypothetical protein